jgi:glycosyltransferase involved in cell wall biosynthesis
VTTRDRPIRVVHVITRLILGGAQENTLYTAIGQHRNPVFDVTLVVGSDDGTEGSLREQAQSAGLRVVEIPSLVRPIRPLTDAIALWRLYRLFRQEQFEIVHTHSSKAGILGRIAARAARVPIVVHTLHSLVFHEYQSAVKNSAYIALKRLCAPLTDVLISVNDKTTAGALARHIGRPQQYLTIHTGMQLDAFLKVSDSLDVEDAKRRWGIPARAPVVGKIARLFPLKGHTQFFDAVEEIAKRRPDAHFLLVGDGPLRADLESRAHELGILNRTHFIGRVLPDQVPACIQAMDVVVHTSLREGIARVLPQAGAVGKPVVTFALDGAPEVIQDGVTGYLVPPLETTALAARVVELLENPALRDRMGQAGRRVSLEHFQIDHMIDRINAVYFDLLARHAITVPPLPPAIDKGEVRKSSISI